MSCTTRPGGAEDQKRGQCGEGAVRKQREVQTEVGEGDGNHSTQDHVGHLQGLVSFKEQ